MRRALPVLLVPLLLPALVARAEAPRLPELEQAVADRLAEREVPGERVYISAEGRPFLGLYLEGRDVMPQGAVVLVHGFGGHPDWPDVISPLRRTLPGAGWATLSIQLPRLSPEASHAMEEELPRRAGVRLAAAVAWLAQRHGGRVVVIGVGFGAAVATRYLASAPRGVSAFVAVSLQAPEHLVQAVGFPQNLEGVRVPMLDVQAENDVAVVLAQAPQRELWGRKGKERPYDRLVIAGATSGFHGHEQELAVRIEKWLVANATPAPPR